MPSFTLFVFQAYERSPHATHRKLKRKLLFKWRRDKRHSLSRNSMPVCQHPVSHVSPTPLYCTQNRHVQYRFLEICNGCFTLQFASGHCNFSLSCQYRSVLPYLLCIRQAYHNMSLPVSVPVTCHYQPGAINSRLSICVAMINFRNYDWSSSSRNYLHSLASLPTPLSLYLYLSRSVPLLGLQLAFSGISFHVSIKQPAVPPPRNYNLCIVAPVSLYFSLFGNGILLSLCKTTDGV